MRTPFEVVDVLMNNDRPNFDNRVKLEAKDWIEKLYDQKEFEFTISTKGSINNPKQETSYKRKLEDLTEQEINFLAGNWLNKFDDRPKESKQ